MIVRSFLPVGQGAFYWERFEKKFNIVYDCGSVTDKHLAEQAVIQNFHKGEEITALFISHLDEDHVNGIPFLLQYCKVKRIYFPIISARDRTLLSIYCDIHHADEFLSLFIEDPASAIAPWAREYTPHLFPVGGMEDDDRYENERYGDNVNELPSTPIGSGTNVFSSFTEINSSSGAKAVGSWELVPFNFRQKQRVTKLMDHLKKEFGYPVTEQDLKQMWASPDPQVKAKIKAAYRKVPGGLNVNSMTLFSGERTGRFRQTPANTPCCPCGVPCCLAKPSGCLYTGDYDASGSQKWRALSDAYQEYWEHIGCVQIPHHGSRYSFNRDLMTADAFFIISAGNNNRYHHPHASVLKKLLMNGIMPHIVTASPESAFQLKIR